MACVNRALTGMDLNSPGAGSCRRNEGIAMARTVHSYRPVAPRSRLRRMLTSGVGAFALLAVVATACSSGKGSTGTAASTTIGGASPSTVAGSGSSSSSSAVTLDPCSVVTDTVATKVYGAGATVTGNPSTDKLHCQVVVKGLSYDLNVLVGASSDYSLQKSIAFKSPTAFPGLGKEAVIGTSSDETGAELGLLYRTDAGMVYLSGESDQAKLTALARAIAAQG